MINKIILISGKKQVGKDTFANFFMDCGYIRIALADELKRQLTFFLNFVVKLESPVTLADFYQNKDRKIKLKPKTEKNNLDIRKWMQTYGRVMKKYFGKYYWSDLLIEEIKAKNKNKNIVVPDVRFPYEIQRIQERLSNIYNIILIRINRNNEFVDNDISETALDLYEEIKYDYVIDNNKSIDDLKKIFRKIYDNI